jgi:hypothetical protein
MSTAEEKQEKIALEMAKGLAELERRILLLEQRGK